MRRGPRGSISRLPSGSLRVRVYAGINQVTGREQYLRQTIPASPTAAADAEAACRRLLDRVRQRCAPRTEVTVSELVDRHLALLHATEITRRSHRRMAGKHIHPGRAGSCRSSPSGRLRRPTVLRSADLLGYLRLSARGAQDHSKATMTATLATAGAGFVSTAGLGLAVFDVPRG